jgi:hypothetical protein
MELFFVPLLFFVDNFPKNLYSLNCQPKINIS